MKYQEYSFFYVSNRFSQELFVKQAPEPLDIIWENMSGDRGLNFVRRFFLTIITVIILVFFTTPNVNYGFFIDLVGGLSSIQRECV
jgi:hypothetical protein